MLTLDTDHLVGDVCDPLIPALQLEVWVVRCVTMQAERNDCPTSLEESSVRCRQSGKRGINAPSQ